MSMFVTIALLQMLAIVPVSDLLMTPMFSFVCEILYLMVMYRTKAKNNNIYMVGCIFVRNVI